MENSFKKSSKCATSTCVEVSINDDAVVVRDSVDPDGAFLAFTPAEWTDFIEGAKLGEFDI